MNTNEYIKLNAKYWYGIRALDMHAKMPYTSDANIFTYLRRENNKANIFTYLRKENNKLNVEYCFVIC